MKGEETLTTYDEFYHAEILCGIRPWDGDEYQLRRIKERKEYLDLETKHNATKHPELRNEEKIEKHEYFFGPDHWDCDGVDHTARLTKGYLKDMGDGTYACIRPE